MKITKNTTIKDALRADLKNFLILRNFGLDCVNCSHSGEETLEMGAKIHNINLNKLLSELNSN